MTHVDRSHCHSPRCDGHNRHDRADDFRESILNKELDSLKGRIDRMKDSFNRHKDDLSPSERHAFRERISQLEHKADRLQHDINHGHLNQREFKELSRELDRFEDQVSDARHDLREEIRDGHCGSHHNDGCHGGSRPEGNSGFEWVPGRCEGGQWIPGHWERSRADSGCDEVNVRDHREHGDVVVRDHRHHDDVVVRDHRHHDEND